MPSDENGSTRLRDRAHSALERRRDHGGQPDGSTRLRDRARTSFERRRQQARRARDAVGQQAESFADALDLDPDRIEPVQLDDRGEEMGFVPDDSGQDILGRRFADDRQFVEPDDAEVDADPRAGVETRTDPEQRDEIADRARSELAGDAEFIEPLDLAAEVGPGGVEDVQTRPGRRDDIADRARAGLAADDPFAEPGDFGVEVGPQGIDDAGLTDTGERRRAGRQFADSTPLEGVGPDEVRQSGDGFELREGPQREIAAIEFERETPLREVDPQTDVTRTGDGFGLREPAQRRSAARSFEDAIDLFGPEDLATDDVRQTDDGFGLAREPARELAAERLDEQIEEFDIGPGDIELEETDSGEFEGRFEREVSR